MFFDFSGFNSSKKTTSLDPVNAAWSSVKTLTTLNPSPYPNLKVVFLAKSHW